MNRSQADITTGLVGYWKFDEGSGTTATDSSGNNNTGTLINGPTWTTGQINSALSFDGVNDYVNIPTLPNGTGSFSVGAWVNVTSATVSAPYGAGIVTHINGGSIGDFSLNVDAYRGITFLNDRAGGDDPTGRYHNHAIGGVFSGNQTQLALNTWYFIAATWDGSATKIYVNGINQTLSNESIGATLGAIHRIGMFGALAIYTFPGLIDEVRVYNRALSASEALELYNYTGGGTSTPTPSGTPSPTPSPSGTPSPSPPPDIIPPVRSNDSPSGTLPSGTTQTTLSLTTNENATCRYSTNSGIAYTSMTNTFSTTGGTTHSATITGLSNGVTYNYYIRCQDQAGNANTDDYTVSFSVSSLSTGEIIPLSRRVTWQGNVGVTGDIPNRTTICATLFPSGGNDTPAIQTAINNCPSGQVVKLNAGTFLLDSAIVMPSNKTLRGAGMGSTILQGTVTAANNFVAYLVTFRTTGYDPALANEPHYDIIGGLTKGSTTITTSATHNWSPGDIIVIDQLPDPSGDPPKDGGIEGCSYCARPWTGTATRYTGQVVKLIAPTSGTTATLEIPLYIDLNISMTPQATRADGMISYAGVEDLTIDNTLSGNTNQENYGTVDFEAAQNSWLYRVEVIGSWRSLIKFYTTYRNTVRSCVFHEGIPATPIVGNQYGSGRGYGVALSPMNSANLVEDNVIYHLSAGIIFNGVCSGNVFAYNYIHTLYYSSAGFVRDGIFAHGAWPSMNLYEGNYTIGLIGADDYHGPASWNTIFRNYVPAEVGKTGYIWSISLACHSWYHNVVGNILGTYGIQNVYEYSGNDPAVKTIYALSYQGCSDPQVSATLLRHGNWDNVNNAVVWDPNISNHILPASLYLSAKPAWWGSLAWPPIGPDLSPMAGNIPAKQRYEGGGDTTPPASPTGVTVN